MTRPRRTLLLIVAVGLLLFVGLAFRRDLLAYLIVPVATVIWLFLRMFVLSIDQQVYWSLLILLTVSLAVARLVRWLLGTDTDPLPASNPTLDQVTSWRITIGSDIQRTVQGSPLRRDLMWLLTSTYSPGREGGGFARANFQIEEALRQHQIPLPASVHAFLFAHEVQAPRTTFSQDPIGFLEQLLRPIRLAPGKWIRRWTGREAAEYYRAVDELLAVIETTLEMHDDPEPTQTDHH